MAIVVSHTGVDFAELAARALRQAPLSDLIELRLDRIGDPGRGALSDFVRAVKKPVIVAVHGSDAWGDFTGDDDEHLAILHGAAEAGVAFVDVPWRLALDLGPVAGKCHRIVSRHETEGVPDDLDLVLEDVRAVLDEGDLVKLVALAHTTNDGLRMLRFLRRVGGGLIGFCAGEAGSFTRVLAPIFGSPFTYAAPAVLDGRAPEPTAPGQIRANDLRAIFPPGGVSQETAIFGVVGNPVKHSFSPWVHGMALKAAKLDAVYVAFEPADFDSFLALADDLNFRGFSVTAPFKQAAFGRGASSDEAARRARAANTLVREGSAWRAANTDSPAILETLERAFRHHGNVTGRPVALPVAHTLVLGTGGSARSAATAVRDAHGRVTIAGRDARKAEALAKETGCAWIPWDAIATTDYDCLVHATPVGSRAVPGACPIPEDWIRPGTLVLDCVYRPIRTPLLAAARARGCTAIPGGEWFVRQAREQFRLFTRTEADEGLLRAAFESALAAEGRSEAGAEGGR